MQRLNRTRLRLLNAFLVSSALFSIATAVLWIRSYRTADKIQIGYWNYRPHVGAPSYRDADMVLALHNAGHWTIGRTRRNCVAEMPSDGYAGYYHAGPGKKRRAMRPGTSRR